MVAESAASPSNALPFSVSFGIGLDDCIMANWYKGSKWVY